jgi:hypothetical protein
MADGCERDVEGSGPDAPEVGLELGKCHFDRVQIGRVGRSSDNGAGMMHPREQDQTQTKTRGNPQIQRKRKPHQSLRGNQHVLALMIDGPVPRP